MPKVTNRYKTPHSRRRKKKTDFRARLKMVKSGKIRIVIRKSTKNMIIQFVEFHMTGDKTLLCVSSKLLGKHEWKSNFGNVPSSYLIGLMAGKYAIKKGIKNGIIDLGLQISSKGSRIYAAIKGLIDAGLEIPVSEKMFPDEKRIRGEHIVKWKETPESFDIIKTKIIGG